MKNLFRNIDASPDDPVESWGVEGMLAALDRGGDTHWAKMGRAIAANPALAEDFAQAAQLAEDTGAVAAVRALVKHLTRTPEQEAFDEFLSLFRQTGLTQREVAQRLGTSQPRLSTYLAGKVMPSAAMLVALRRIVDSQRIPGMQ